MRINLKIGDNCSITKISDNKLNVKLNLALNNFNNSTFKQDARIYIESINFPVLQDSLGADILNGSINISTNSIEPDYNDFNSYQNMNNPMPIFTAKINDLKYSSTSQDLYNFKINSSFMNNCSFILEFLDLDGANVFHQTTTQTNFLGGGIAENPSVSGALVSSGDLDVAIVSGAVDSGTRDGPPTGHTFPHLIIPLTSPNQYTVSRAGIILSVADHPFCNNQSFQVALQVSNLEVIGLLQTIDGGNGATFQVGDLITVDKSVFGSSALDDVVFQVNSIGLSTFEIVPSGFEDPCW